MAGWQLTLGLQNLRSQVNEYFPGRDHTSDGTIGDTAHEAETSGHNADDTPGSRPEWDGDPDTLPEVRAWDMDSDLRSPGVSAQDVVDHIRRLPDVSSELRYIIYNRKIYRASNGWQPETYTGASAHTEHVHFSGAYSQAADNDTSFDYHLEDLTMTPEQIAAAVWNYLLEDPLSTTTPKAKKSAGAYQRYNDAVTNDAASRIGAQVAALNVAVAQLAGKDMVDEQAIVTGVLGGLTPEKIAAAIPGDVAQQVVDLLLARLSN